EALVQDRVLELGPVMAQEALHRPSRSLTECTDGVSLDLPSRFAQHMKVLHRRAHVGNTTDHAVHPAGALAAWRALAATLLEIEPGNALAGAHHAGGLIHHDHRART